MSRLSPLRAICYGGLTVGGLDLADAFLFFYLRSGARPTAILHSIAAGVLGPTAARTGGAPSALLGLLLHFTIAVVIVAIYVGASRVVPVLRRHVLAFGVAYGLVAYVVMNFVVVPASNARTGATMAWPVVMNGLLIHAFGVGVPAAWFASRVRRR